MNKSQIPTYNVCMKCKERKTMPCYKVCKQCLEEWLKFYKNKHSIRADGLFEEWINQPSKEKVEFT